MPEPPTGSVYVEVRVTKRIALSRIVKWWTVEEAELLVAGDAAAREELIEQAKNRALADPDDADVEVSQIWIEPQTTANNHNQENADG